MSSKPDTSAPSGACALLTTSAIVALVIFLIILLNQIQTFKLVGITRGAGATLMLSRGNAEFAPDSVGPTN